MKSIKDIWVESKRFTLAKLLNQSNVILSLWFFAILYVVLAVIGGIKNFSPVPYWDTWDSMWLSFDAWSFESLWRQHNEHRIVITRIILWIDFAVFYGTFVFPIILNYVFSSLAFVIFFFCIKEILNNNTLDSSITRNIITPIVLILLFSWAQKDNFTWEFQSQFFLAQIMPLTSFYLIHRSFKSSAHSLALFVLSCLVGIASIGTMANGILALPLMTALIVALRMKLRYFVVTAILSILTIIAYFYDYHSPGYHGSVIKTILEDPIGLIEYSFAYLGNPLQHYFSNEEVAKIAGLILILNSIFFAFKFIKNPSQSSLQLALLTFIFFVEITSVITGGGRLIFGINQAFSGRYATPVLMAWSALLIIYVPIIAKGIGVGRLKWLPIVFLFLPIVFLPNQILALESQKDVIFAKEIAALAIDLGIKDRGTIILVYPDASRAVSIAAIPAKMNLSIFGNPLIKDAALLLGTEEKIESSVKCLGSLDLVSKIDNDTKYFSIQGWLFDQDSKSVPKIIHLTDRDHKIIGYALSGGKRSDVGVIFGKEAVYSGFKGYLLSDANSKKVILRGINPDCELTVNLPPIEEIKINQK